jgi:ankyrin repeat protein
MRLIAAVLAGDEAEVRRLIASGADVNELGDQGRTPLIEAAGKGDVRMVRLLLEAGAEPGWKDQMEETALLKAAAGGHREVYQVLLPLAGEDERGMARAFLGASAQSWDQPPPRPPPSRPEPENKMGRAVATAAARVAKFFGDEVHSERLDRLERAEGKPDKKR